MNNPLVSIITANYNKDKYLPDMLQSIKRQLYTNIEHIIVDDGSTDNSHSLLKEYGEKNSYTKKMPFMRNSYYQDIKSINI